MTTFQEQPHQSRRAVRQSERENATGTQAASTDIPVTPAQPPFAQPTPPPTDATNDTGAVDAASPTPAAAG